MTNPKVAIIILNRSGNQAPTTPPPNPYAPVHPNHKRVHTHIPPTTKLPAGKRHLGWWIGGVVVVKGVQTGGTRRLLVVEDFAHKHLYMGSKTRFRWW